MHACLPFYVQQFDSVTCYIYKKYKRACGMESSADSNVYSFTHEMQIIQGRQGKTIVDN